MKSAVFALALAGSAVAQNLAGEPECASSCLISAISAAGCAPNDVACQCGPTQHAIATLVAPCLLAGCAGSALIQAESAGLALCSQFSASAGGGPATASASTTTSTSGSGSTTSGSGSGTTETSKTATTSSSSSSATTKTSTRAGGGGSGGNSTVTTGPKTTKGSGGSGGGGAGGSSTSTAGAATLGAGMLAAFVGLVAAL